MIVQIHRNIGWDQVSHSNCTLMLRTVFPFLSFYILEGTLLHLVTLWHLATFFFSLLWKANVHGPLGWKMSYNLPIFPHCCFLNRIQIDILWMWWYKFDLVVHYLGETKSCKFIHMLYGCIWAKHIDRFSVDIYLTLTTMGWWGLSTVFGHNDNNNQVV